MGMKKFSVSEKQYDGDLRLIALTCDMADTLRKARKSKLLQ
jgi:hypothetical protein